MMFVEIVKTVKTVGTGSMGFANFFVGIMKKIILDNRITEYLSYHLLNISY